MPWGQEVLLERKNFLRKHQEKVKTYIFLFHKIDVWKIQDVRFVNLCIGTRY